MKGDFPTSGPSGKVRVVSGSERIDKRRWRRMPLRPIPCRVFQDCQLIDLSIGGAFLMTPRPFPKGSLFSIEVALPGQRTIRAVAQVEHVGDYFDGVADKPCPGMGVSFTEIAPEDRIAVTRFLTSLYEVSRTGLRVDVDLPARVRIGEAWVAGLIRELSERMVLVATGATAAIGTDVHVLLKIPGARAPLEARGVVLAVTGGAGDDGDEGGLTLGLERGLRIEMHEIPPKSKEVLDAYLAELRKDAAEASDV